MRFLQILTLFSILVSNKAFCADTPREQAARQFQDEKLGIMFHWGISSLLGKGEWVMDREALPIEQYKKLATQFNPAKFDSEAWVKAAKGAGARYVVYLAKHHDGFAMYDSKLTDFDIVQATPYAKDPLALLAESCRKAGIRLVIYYSLLDWHHPDYYPRGESGKKAGRPERGEWSNYVAYYQGQLRELCTAYGPIGGVWLDGMNDRPDADWDLETTYKLIHELQPQALIGNNHHQKLGDGEDFQIHESEPPVKDYEARIPKETLVSLNNSWGYTARDHNYITNDDLIRKLVRTVAVGSNVLINVAVKPDGMPPTDALEKLTSLGYWTESNADAFRGTVPGPVGPQPWGATLAKANRLFVHVLKPDIPVILPLSYASYDIRLSGASERLDVTHLPAGIEVELPTALKPVADRIIVVQPIPEPRKRAGIMP